MKADEALERAVVAWRTKHHIREDDPMLAALDLVRVYLAHAPLPARDAAEVLPTYAEFRETVEFRPARKRLWEAIARPDRRVAKGR